MKSHTEYLVELNARFDELAEYLPPTTDPVEIERRQEQDKVYIYLGGLDSSYEAVRSQILLSPELPSYSAIVAMVQREDSRRAAMSSEVQRNNQAVETLAFAVSGSNLDRGRNKSEKCSHCKKLGHTSDRCWVLHPHLKPRWKGDGGYQSQGEVAKKNTKTLDGRQEEKKGFLAKGEASRSESIPEVSRLDRIDRTC
jgi:hypothetical protein